MLKFLPILARRRADCEIPPPLKARLQSGGSGRYHAVSHSNLERRAFMTFLRILAWIVPILLTCVYAALAVMFRQWLIDRYDRPTASGDRLAEELTARALGWPLTALLGIVGAALLFGLWPIRGSFSVFTFGTIRLAFIAWFVACGFEMLRVQAQAGPEDSLLAHRGIVAVLRAVMALFGTVIALEILGIAMMPVIIFVSAIGLVVALAMRESLGNFFCGFCLTLDRPVKPGDVVRLESGETGRVESLGWTSARVVTPQGRAVSIPNRKILDSMVTTLAHEGQETPVEIRVTLDAEAPVEKAKKSALNAAKAVMKSEVNLAGSAEPLVLIDEISAAGLEVRIVLTARSIATVEALRDAFLTSLARRYQSEKIAFSSTHAWPAADVRR